MQRPRYGWCLLLLSGVLELAAAQTVPRVPAQFPDYYRIFRQHESEGFLTRVVLPNGLPVLVEEHPLSPLAAISTTVKAGPPDVESAMAAEQLTRRLDRSLRPRGAWSDWSFTADGIEFSTLLPADEVLHGIDGHLQLMRPAEPVSSELLMPGAMKRLEGHRRRFPGAWGAKALALWGEVAPSSAEPIAAAAVGPEAESGRRLFLAGRVALAVSGSVRHEVILRKLADLAPDLPSLVPMASSANPPVGPPAGGFRYSLEREGPVGPMITLAFQVPPSGHPDRLPLELTRCLLSEGEAAYLRLPRVEETLRPFVVRSGYTATADSELMVFVLSPAGGQIERAEARFLAAVEVLRRGPLPGVLLKRAQAWMVSDHFLGLSTLEDRAAGLGRAELGGHHRNRDRFPDQVAALRETDVRRVLTEYLTFERLAVVESLPAGAEARDFTPESFLETLKILVTAEVAAEAGFLETLQGETPAFRPPQAEPNFSEVDLRRSSILRGPEVFVRELHTVPMVHLAFFYPGGRSGESAAIAGITELMTRSLIRHLTQAPGGRNWLELESAGASVEPVVEQDFFGLVVKVPSRALPAAFRQVMDWIRTDPRPTAEHIEEARHEAKVSTWWEDSRCQVPLRLLDRARAAVFGEHPYALVQPWCDGNPNVTVEDLESWRSNLVRRVYPHIMALGDVSGTSFLQDQIPLLSDRNFAPGKFSVTRPDFGVREGKLEEESDGTAVVSFAGPRVGSDDVEILDVALALLNGPWGRLNRRFEDSGIPGSAQLVRESDSAGGILHLEIRTAAGGQEAGRRAALEAVRSLVEAQVPEPEFLSGLVRTITRYTGLQDRRDRYLRETMTAVLADEPVDYARRYVLNIRQMRIGEVETAIRRHFGEGP